MSEGRHIFVSYSRKDVIYAYAIMGYLIEQGFDVWLDQLQLPWGTNFPIEIERAIKDCAVFMPLLSANSKLSEWVYNEVGFAKHLNKPQLPIFVGGEPWIQYMSTNHLDLSKLNLSDLIHNESNDILIAQQRLEPFITSEFLKDLLNNAPRNTQKSGTVLQPTTTPEVQVESEWQSLNVVILQKGSLKLEEAIRHIIKLTADLIKNHDEEIYPQILPTNVRYKLGEFPIVEWSDHYAGSENILADTMSLGQLLYFMLAPPSTEFGDTRQPLESINTEIVPALSRILMHTLNGEITSLEELRLRLELFDAEAELRQALDASDGHLFKVDEVVQNAIRLCNQLEEDHKNGFAHHQLHSENVIIESKYSNRQIQWIEAVIIDHNNEVTQNEIRDDVFAIGAILYEMLTGLYPQNDMIDGKLQFTGASVWVKIGLDRIVEKACNPQATLRYRNVVILRERLNDFLRELNFARELDTLMTSRYPILYIHTWEEERLFSLLTRIITIDEWRKPYGWTVSQGLFDQYGQTQEEVPADDPLAILDHIVTSDNDSIYILYDYHPYLKRPHMSPIRRRFRDLATQTRFSSRQSTIIISPLIEIPSECEKDITILHHWLPRVGELAEVLDDVINQVTSANYTVNLSNDEYESLVRSARGLTTREASRAFLRSVMLNVARIEKESLGNNSGSVVLDSSAVQLVLAEKERVVKESRSLQIYSTPENFGDIGGLDQLKAWLRQRGAGFSIRAKDFGLPAPKGLLLVGVPGCGKSLAAKAIAAEWHQPLLRLDAGALFSSTIGSSEQNLREALSIAEAMAPAVLWIDEIEKAFAGVNRARDSGVSARVFGTLITWLQEKTEPVFVVATANNISTAGGGSGLPPELLRRGRFDEIFFVDLPTTQERIEILALHLAKRGLDVTRFDLPRLARECAGFSGAEIEQLVISAMYEAFVGNDLARQRAQEVIKHADMQQLNAFSEEELMEALQILILESLSSEPISESPSPALDAVRNAILESSYLHEQLQVAIEQFDEEVKKRKVTVNLDEIAIRQAIQEVVPLAEVMGAQLNSIRQWAKEKRLRFASSPEDKQANAERSQVFRSRE